MDKVVPMGVQRLGLTFALPAQYCQCAAPCCLHRWHTRGQVSTATCTTWHSPVNFQLLLAVQVAYIRSRFKCSTGQQLSCAAAAALKGSPQ